MVSEAHIPIHHQCAACSQLFWPGERLVALLYRNLSLEIHKDILFKGMGQYCEQLSERELHKLFCKRPGCIVCFIPEETTFVHPDSLSEGPEVVFNTFCKRPLCALCRTAEETISVHTDCLQLFEQQCIVVDGASSSERRDEQYRRLWIAGTRRYAWREMQPLKFPSSTTLAIPPPETISNICGFQKGFPPEVIRLVQSHSQSHILWRYCSVIRLAQELGSAEAEKAATYPVSKVLSWSRGSPPKLVEDERLAGSFIRLTIDPHGIRSIERFSDTPESTARDMPAASCVFVVEPVEKLSDAKIEFELGMSRLQVPALLRISVWSTPNPLHLKNVAPYPYHRLAAISLNPDDCTGISFFMSCQVVHEIHAHSTRHSTHLERFKYIRSMFNYEVTWIYIPLTARDKITAVEVRQDVTTHRPHLFTIWTKTGKFVVGTPQKVQRRQRPGTTKKKECPGRRILYETEQDGQRPLNLIHEIPGSGLMTFIATNADKQTVNTETDIHRPDPWPLPHAFFSSASLEGVLNVHVFNDKRRNMCKGILLEYENGSKRALGQCRLGWDLVQSWRKPLSLFYAPTTYECRVPEDVYFPTKVFDGVRVAFDSESNHICEDGELENNYYGMKGYLNFWFRINDVELEIVGS